MRKGLLPLLLLGIVAGATAGEATYRAAVLVEPTTGTVLQAENAEEPLPVASMVKMLTLLVVEDALDAEEVTLGMPVRVSKEVHLVDGTGVYLAEGEVHRFEDLRAAAAIHSANDAAAALAETVAGSTEDFVDRMRVKGTELGLRHLDVHTPHGLDTEETGLPLDRMSALDLARLGIAFLRDPDLMELAGTKTRSFPDREFLLYNSNHLLRRLDFATGIKTGYHPEADFGVTASAEQDGMSLIAVVVGAKEKGECFRVAETMLREGFNRYRMMEAVRGGEVLPRKIRVRSGARSSVEVMAGHDLRWVEPRDRVSPLEIRVVGLGKEAPIRPGQPVGTVFVYQEGRLVGGVPAVATLGVERTGVWSRWWQALKRLVPAFVGRRVPAFVGGA